ncbi:hypothetical protein T484DRAFT_1783957, partial [Baffinella frigidus]
ARETALAAARARLAAGYSCGRDAEDAYAGDAAMRGRACVEPTRRLLSEAMQEQSRVGFSTESHTGVDILVYAAGRAASSFRGCLENDEVGRRMWGAVGLSVSRDAPPIEEALELCGVVTSG